MFLFHLITNMQSSVSVCLSVSAASQICPFGNIFELPHLKKKQAAGTVKVNAKVY